MSPIISMGRNRAGRRAVGRGCTCMTSLCWTLSRLCMVLFKSFASLDHICGRTQPQSAPLRCPNTAHRTLRAPADCPNHLEVCDHLTQVAVAPDEKLVAGCLTCAAGTAHESLRAQSRCGRSFQVAQWFGGAFSRADSRHSTVDIVARAKRCSLKSMPSSFAIFMIRPATISGCGLTNGMHAQYFFSARTFWCDSSLQQQTIGICVV